MNAGEQEIPRAEKPHRAATFGIPRSSWWAARRAQVRHYFLGVDPTFWSAMVPAMTLAALLYTRSLTTNFIFDEQEALLANPYVNGRLRVWEVIHRDFWGLPPERSVGSYRPLPNLLWRGVASSMRWLHEGLQRWIGGKATYALYPWVFHWCNVVLHATNGALLVCLVFHVSRRRGLAWLSGAIFTACAVLTEAVSGVVGTADVLGGLGALLALYALRWPTWGMLAGVFSAMLLGLFAKESALVCVPLVPLAAWWLAPYVRPARPRAATRRDRAEKARPRSKDTFSPLHAPRQGSLSRDQLDDASHRDAAWLRAAVALVASAGAFVLYVECRKRWFPSATAPELLEPLHENSGRFARAARGFLLWFHQPALPRDELNNPLTTADAAHRVAGAWRVYFRGLEQLVWPHTLSGDYSFPQEPVPARLFTVETVLGGVCMVLPPFIAIAVWLRGEQLRRGALSNRRGEQKLRHDEVAVRPNDELSGPAQATLSPWPGGEPSGRAAVTVGESTAHRVGVGHALVALSLVWIVVSYFPHSNIPVLLPTVRAERFWYFPALGSSVLLASYFAAFADTSRATRTFGGCLFALLFSFQCVKARLHALDYNDDLTFWRATKDAVPRSAKAHLNYSVMWGARGHLDTRLSESRIAAELAPSWAMAHVYLGDTLCRLHRPGEAWPHYVRGFKLAPADPNLVALGLQCLWDEKAFETHEDELLDLGQEHPDSWLDFLVRDVSNNGAENGGVNSKYRPRGYNEGPKE